MITPIVPQTYYYRSLSGRLGRFFEFAQTRPSEEVRPLLPTILTLIQRAARYIGDAGNGAAGAGIPPALARGGLFGVFIRSGGRPGERQMLWRNGAHLLQGMDALAWLDDNPHHPPFIGMFH